MSLASKYRAVLARITRSAEEHGRDPGDIQLLAASKGQSLAAIRELAGLGQRFFGENYLQEALPKLAGCDDLALEWHFIGQIQSNKTAMLAARFRWVQTLDSARLAQRLNDQRQTGLPPLHVCLQVKLDDEPGKAGIAPRHLVELAEQVAALPRLQLRGLMAIPAPAEGFAAQRRSLRRLKVLYDQLLGAGHPLDTLSMGMSADLEAAVAEGATMVRIGSALFGPRTPKRKESSA